MKSATDRVIQAEPRLRTSPPDSRGERYEAPEHAAIAGLMLGFLRLAVTALFLTGIFVFLVAIARTPLVVLIAGRSYLYTALVAHVTFALNVWLLSFLVVLWLAEAARLSLPLRIGWLRGSAALAWLGLGLLAVIPLAGVGQPVLADYIPILLHPLFLAGLITFGAGILVAAVGFLLAVSSRLRGGLPLPTQALTIAAVGYLAALGILALTAIRDGTSNIAGLVWGTGHLLQLANAAALIAGWLLISPIPGRRSLRLAQVSLLGFIVAIAVVTLAYALAVPWESVGALFWSGVGLPLVTTWLVTLVACIRQLRRGERRLVPRQGLLVSFILFGAGGLIPLAGMGNDTRITAHYHGVVGAVTVVFMTLAYRLLARSGLRWAWPGISRFQPHLYGGGLLLIVAGLFWAGDDGTARKTFEAISSNPSLVVAEILFALGAIATVTGGIVFVVGVGRPLLPGAAAAARSSKAGSTAYPRAEALTEARWDRPDHG